MSEDGYGDAGYGEGGYGDEDLESTSTSTGDFDTWRTTEYDDPTIELLDSVPEYYNDNLGSENHDLFEPIGQHIDALDNDLALIEQEMFATTAQRYKSLELIADLVGIEPMDAEHIEHFRARIIAGLHGTTSDGTTSDLLTGVAAMLNCPISAITYEIDPPEDIILTVPQDALDQAVLTASEAADLSEQLVAPTKDVQFQVMGTFRFQNTDTYGQYDLHVSSDETISIGPDETVTIRGSRYTKGFTDTSDSTTTGGTLSVTVGEETA